MSAGIDVRRFSRAQIRLREEMGDENGPGDEECFAVMMVASGFEVELFETYHRERRPDLEAKWLARARVLFAEEMAR